MASEKATIREGLIEVVPAERFKAKPLSGTNTHVVVMHKSGGTLRHYCTLRSSQDRLSIGEQLWGDYVCYVVDLAERSMRIEQDLATSDHITNVHVVADIIYHVIDGEQVALGVDDALASLRENLLTILRREIVRLPLEAVTEENLEARVEQEKRRVEARLGIAVVGVRVQVRWPEEVLASRRASAEAKRQREAEDAKRRRAWQIDDESRVRKQRIDLGDIDHIGQVIEKLGLDGLPVDLRLHLHSLPQKEALQKIIEIAAEQRKRAQDIVALRMQEEYAILRKLIDDKVLDGMDLEEFGRDLLERYRHSLAFDQTLGMPSAFLFGEAERPRARLTSEEPEKEELAADAAHGAETAEPEGEEPASEEETG